MPIEEGLWLPVIGRSLALLALHKAELGNASIGEKATFLESLGIPRNDVAALLGTSSDVLRVLASRSKKSGGRARGKRKKD